MLKLLIIIIFSFQLAFPKIVSGQGKININNLKSNFAKGENKEKFYTNLIKNIETTLKGNLIDNYNEWRRTLNDAQSILLKNDFVKNGLIKVFSIEIDSKLKLQRDALEIAYTLYPDELSEMVYRVLMDTNDEISFAIASHYLLSSTHKIIDKDSLKVKLTQKFKNFSNSEILNELHNDLADNFISSIKSKPSLSELLTHSFQVGSTIVYSFHRKNRNYSGITLIKAPNGEFVKNEDGTIFNIPQLAISFSNLPYYIPNGNTPQGIYSIIGWYISPTETIGPTPNILVRSPFEVKPEIFFHNKNKTRSWSLDDYKSLVPKSWTDYDPIYESYKAGKIGRRLIIMHGSTEETKYFKEFPYYPLTPTKGCLSSKEIWSETTGKCIESDQVKLINAFRSTKQKKGFLVVIELDNQDKPVVFSEIEEYLKNSPQR